MKNKSGIYTSLSLSLLIVLFSVLAGCEGTPTEFEVHETVEALSVHSGSGNITVRAGDVDFIHVHGMVFGDDTTIDHSVNEGLLNISTNCNGSGWNCSVDYTITVPEEISAVLDSGSGDIQLDGISGDGTLSTGSGDIHVQCSSGERLNMDTGSGDINAGSLHYSLMRTSTGSGDIDVRFETEPEEVSLETGSGDIALYLPTNIYDIYADTGSGDISINGVTDDDQAIRAITARTGSGDINIHGR